MDTTRTENDSPPVASLIRLNLGCGEKLWPGFINIDFPNNWSGLKPDLECDITKLPYPDGYADEIHAIHVIEHFPRPQVPDILKAWWRVLKPGGKIVLECPCLDKITQHLASKPKERDAEWFRRTLIGLYGEYWRDEPVMMHKWCYTIIELTALLVRAGFRMPRSLEPLFHLPDRDMRLVTRK